MQQRTSTSAVDVLWPVREDASYYQQLFREWNQPLPDFDSNLTLPVYAVFARSRGWARLPVFVDFPDILASALEQERDLCTYVGEDIPYLIRAVVQLGQLFPRQTVEDYFRRLARCELLGGHPREEVAEMVLFNLPALCRQLAAVSSLIQERRTRLDDYTLSEFERRIRERRAPTQEELVQTRRLDAEVREAEYSRVLLLVVLEGLESLL